MFHGLDMLKHHGSMAVTGGLSSAVLYGGGAGSKTWQAGDAAEKTGQTAGKSW